MDLVFVRTQKTSFLGIYEFFKALMTQIDKRINR